MALNIRWVSGGSTSCLHAAAAMLVGRPLADPALSRALTDPVEALRAELAVVSISTETFSEFLLPLSVGVEGNRELAQVTLAKILGRNNETPDIGRFAGLLADVKRAFAAAVPDLTQQLTLREGPIREQWEARGPGLLFNIKRLIESELLVEEATVVLVYPALGGGGIAHPANNSVRFEAVLANSVEQFPETVRLGWLLSQLNLDLPKYSERVHRDRLRSVVALAMIPPVLASAAEVELARDDAATMSLALKSWRDAWPASFPVAAEIDLADTLSRWWETYQTGRPPFAIALAALDEMLKA
jgi:hypothetical protein